MAVSRKNLFFSVIIRHGKPLFGRREKKIGGGKRARGRGVRSVHRKHTRRTEEHFYAGEPCL